MESFRSEVILESEPPETKRSGTLRFIIDVIETVLISLILFMGINAVSARIRVDGYSMEPTLQSGEFVIVNKMAYKVGTPSRGDVIVFHFPRNPDQEYIKRVIGLPGDQVTIRGGEVYVNGALQVEPYLKSQPAYENDWIVPEDQLFVLGDNRNNSSDSHNWGGVPMENVVGQAVLIYWPPTEWGLIELPDRAMAAP